MGQLANKVIVVTGAASGIGQACVTRCVADGARVIGADIAAAPPSAAVEVVQVDVCDEAAIEALMQRVVADYGRIDGVVNAAGIAGGGPAHLLDAKAWDRVLGQFGAALATREVPGDEIKLESPAGVTVITNGCCQENSAEEMLSLASLKTLYVRSGGAPLTTYTRLGTPALGRIIVPYLAMTPADDAVLGKDPTAVGLIALEGEDEVLQRIRVHLRAAKPREAALEWSVELGWKTAAGPLENHTVIDPAKPSRPVFRWKIDAKQAIEIPLVDDRLDLAAAKLPPAVTLEAVGVDVAAKRK